VPTISLLLLPGFVLVGAIGFLIDAGILTALVNGLGAGHYAARASSFTVAVTATWYMNRRWVFEKIATRKRSREYTSYLIVQAIGAVINLSVFVAAIELVPALAKAPVIPLAIGAAVALLFNFSASSRFVFTSPRKKTARPSEFGQ
jgi:putative flippase GtrA